MSVDQVPSIFATIVPPTHVNAEPGATAEILAGMSPNEIVAPFATVGAITHDVIPPPSPIVP